MSVKPKHGKGKYAYQAKIAGKKQGQQTVITPSDNSGIASVGEIKTDAVNHDIRITPKSKIAAVMPASIGKIDLIFEIKRIGILAAGMLVLLVLLSVVLK